LQEFLFASIPALVHLLKVIKKLLGIKLWELSQFLKSGLRKTGIRISQDHIPIACFETGNAEHMKFIKQQMLKARIYIQYVDYVGSGNKGSLRILVNAFHTRDEIDFLMENLRKLIP